MMNKKRILISFLVIAALIVWSHNIYRLFVGVQSDEEVVDEVVQINDESPDTLLTGKEGTQHYVYQAQSRDPFKHWLLLGEGRKKGSPSPKKNPQMETKKPEVEAPRLRFCGVMEDSTGMLAIVEGSQGEVYFAKEEDVIEGVLVMNITREYMDCRFQDKTFQLSLNGN